MSQTLVDELVAKLEVAIFRGEFPPGTRIREARVANSLGVGRGPVREAVRRLEGRKLVVRHPNRGTSITRLTNSRRCTASGITSTFTIRLPSPAEIAA